MLTSANELVDRYMDCAAHFGQGLEVTAPEVSDALYTVLGCSYTGKHWHEIRTPVSRAADTATYLPKILPVALVLHDRDMTSAQLLSGVARCPCLQECVETEDGAYALASTLINYLRFFSKESNLDVAVMGDILDMVNLWLRPAAPFRVVPSIYTLCEHMFGDLWCNLVLQEDTKRPPDIMNNIDEHCIELIKQQRPPFLRGLCPAQALQLSVPLPDMIGGLL
jgi:hypothetical protein